jgi:hypothetical protein
MCQPARKAFPSPPIRKTKKNRRADDPATKLARMPTQIRFKSWTYMVNDRLFSAVICHVSFEKCQKGVGLLE